MPSPQTLGRYTLVRRIAAGGMAEIWKARISGAAGFEKSVAIKRVLPHLAEDAEFVDMFVEEARLVSGLVHPNIVQVLDFGQIDENYYLAMEFVPGCNVDKLERRLDERAMKLSTPVALFIAAETCKGIGAAHGLTDAKGVSRNLVHRDVSPQNVLVSFAGDVKVGDFGIAKALNLRSRTETGLVRGKSAYMSPEQARGEPLDHRSDLFSVGILLYEMVAGRRLFDGKTTLEVMQKAAGWQGPSPEILAAAPAPLHELLAIALAPQRADRYADAVAMETAISWHLGADSAVRARQALAALVREVFADEAERERADAGSGGELAQTLDMPALPSVPASEAISSRKATRAAGEFAGIGRRSRGQGPIWMYAGGVIVALLAGAIWMRQPAETPFETLPSPTAESGAAAAGATTSAGVLATTGGETQADLTTVPIAERSAVAPSPSPSVSSGPVTPVDVDAHRRAIESRLARRFLTTDDIAGIRDDFHAAELARADGRLLDAQAALDAADRKLADLRLSWQLVSSKLDRVKARRGKLAAEADVPGEEFDASLEQAGNQLGASKFVAANETLYRLEKRIAEFDSSRP